MTEPANAPVVDASGSDSPSDRLIAMLNELQGRVSSLGGAFERLSMETTAQFQRLASESEMRYREQQAHFRHVEDRIDRRRDETRRVEQADRRDRTAPELPQGIKLPKLEKVTGSNQQQLRQWFRTAQGHLQLVKVSLESTAAVFYLSQFFEGDLADWFALAQDRTDSPDGGFDSFDGLKEAALKQFSTRDPREEARDNVDRARQKTSVSKYVAYLRRQNLHLSDRTEADHLHHFLRGLRPEIALEVAKSCHTSLDDAIRQALEVEVQLTRAKTSGRRDGAHLNHAAVESDDSDDSDDDDDSEEEEETELYYLEQKKKKIKKKLQQTNERLQRARQEGRCFECDEVGHRARDCPKKKKNQSGK